MFIVCGEALYDMFVTGEGENGQFAVDARAGGSPYNVATGMALQGSDVALLTGLSNDSMGERLARCLIGRGVSSDYLVRSDRRTTISVVDVGPDGGPAYAFYGAESADCSLDDADIPAIGADVVGLHFGSYSIAVPPVADAFARLAEREARRFISLDPNVRATIQPDMEVWKQRIDHFRGLAGVVKVSEEDLGLLYPDTPPLDVARGWAAGNPAMVIVTQGGSEVLAIRGEDEIRIATERVEVIDTVGAGDAFQATLLAGLSKYSDPVASIRAMGIDEVRALLRRASAAGSITCSRRGAQLPTAADIDQFLVERGGVAG